MGPVGRLNLGNTRAAPGTGTGQGTARVLAKGIAAAALVFAQGLAWACDKPLYLTFDTGHMGVADLVADVLKRQQVPVTFFLASERSLTGGHSLDEQWAPWWRARAEEGHAFASHTWDHWVLSPDAAAAKEHGKAAHSNSDAQGPWRFKVTQGTRRGQVITADARAYCEQLIKPAQRLQAMTGQPMAAAFRAPAGRTSPSLIEAAKACGFEHVGWSPAGFLGDELDSTRFPNEQLLKKALRDIRPGDVLVAHLGIWDRREPWAPAVLEPLIEGLKARGFCFRTMRDHPQHGAAFARVAPMMAEGGR